MDAESRTRIDAILASPPAAQGVEPCPTCQTMAQALKDGLVHKMTFQEPVDGADAHAYTFANLKTSTAESQVALGMVLLFCPFCGGTLGHHPTILKVLRTHAPAH